MVDEKLDPKENQEAEIVEETPDEEEEAIEPEEVTEVEPITEEAEAQGEQTPDVEALEAEIRKLKAQLEETTNNLNRSRADFANFKRRTESQRSSQIAYGKEQVVTALLPVLDNLDLALSHSGTENVESYKKGVELVLNQFRQVLEKEGLSEIEAMGETFNPEYHHGVALEQNPEIEDQKITKVLQKGYSLNDKVIRPSMVTVNQNP